MRFLKAITKVIAIAFIINLLLINDFRASARITLLSLEIQKKGV